MRVDGRAANQLRQIRMIPNFIEYAEGSILIEQGNTRVLCNVTIEDAIPRWMQTQNIPGGWITAEYAMLPRATQKRTPRETNGYSGRTQEIKRLIGRCLRAAVNLEKLGQRTFILDCDVLQADGGTRTAAINGSFVALSLSIRKLIQQNLISNDVIQSQVGAVSVGVIGGEPILDLCYMEDSHAEVDMNIIMNDKNEFIELQGTAETKPFDHELLNRLINLAQNGIHEIFLIQNKILQGVQS